MKIKQGNTELIHDNITRCEDIEDLKEVLHMNSRYYQEWKRFINDVVEVNSLSYEKLGKLCYCSKNTAKRWCLEGRLPQNREAFIKIALGLGLNLEQTNNLLQRFGKYPKLYAKNMEDAILIYLLSHHDFSRDPYDYFLELKDICIDYVKKRQANKNIYKECELEHTQYYFNEIIDTSTQSDFEAFIINNIDIFSKSYSDLIQYIDMFIMSNNSNIHEFVKTKNLNPVFDKLLSILRNKGEVPNRTKLIALGIHLNMTLDQLNKMMEYAYMEPLCAKDKIECAVIYAVENAHLNNPSYAFENAIYLKNYCQSKEIQRQCKDIIRNYMDSKTYERIGDSSEIIDMEDELSNYLKWVLKEIDLDSDEIFTLL